ncbi:radial spoke protein 3 [Reticulomyxa filosa]|uniref:Radial spoke protein 3 n=1 Tax=Reticulomyxa filosa TaxID=46433 RepID=X6NGT7_RETFI|nr:radial spoke protein 3 [Reticulomyxa filosa]|eukprot:ETO25123.1 radial spoke protein 3 [Reticulomyxa filosa]
MQQKTSNCHRFLPIVSCNKEQLYQPSTHIGVSCEKKKSYYNMMFDPRVVRGNTYSLYSSLRTQPESCHPSCSSSAVHQKHTYERCNIVFKENINDINKLHHRKFRSLDERSNQITANPVSGRENIGVQTDSYLEEISVECNSERFQSTQTDPLLDRPSTPEFIPKSSGHSVSIQVECNELFDFDHEIEPILETLLGKTLEQSLMEVCEETEYKIYHEQKAVFEQRVNTLLNECQILEMKEERLVEEQNNRNAQLQSYKIAQERLKTTVRAREAAKDVVCNLEALVLQELEAKGYFSDPIAKEIRNICVPAVTQQAQLGVDTIYSVSQQCVEDVVNNAVADFFNDANQSLVVIDPSPKHNN